MQARCLNNAAVFGHDDKDPCCSSTRDPRYAVSPFQDLDDLAFRPTTAVRYPRCARSLDRRAGLHAWYAAPGNVRALSSPDDKTESVSMALYAPPDQIRLVRQKAVAASIAHQLSVTNHCPKPARKNSRLLLADINASANASTSSEPHAQRGSARHTHDSAAAVHSWPTRVRKRIGPSDRASLTTAPGEACCFSLFRDIDNSILVFIIRVSLPRWRNW